MGDSATDTHLDPSVPPDAQKDISTDERHSSQLEVRTEKVTVPVSDESTAALAPPTTTSTAATQDGGSLQNHAEKPMDLFSDHDSPVPDLCIDSPSSEEEGTPFGP